jgi:RHS repeat-associated protein
MPTDRRYTGQQEDATGIYYMNARYYDPQIGQFLSPDTIVPEPALLIDYNRYLYTRGNPLKYNDPTGHETSKPDWWPDWLPYTLDLPDELTVDSFDEWIAENNIYTNIGGQVGFNTTLMPYVGGETSMEVGYYFNWRSGELVYMFDSAIGTGAGLPDVGFGAHAGVTFIAGAGPGQSSASIEGLSRYTTASGELECLGLEGGLGATVSEAIENRGDNSFVVPGDPYKDLYYNRTVNSLAVNLGFGADALSVPVQQPEIPIDGRITTGLQQTRVTNPFNVYAPIQWLLGPFQ